MIASSNANLPRRAGSSWKWLVGTLVCLLLLGVAAVGYLHHWIVRSSAFQESLSRALSSPALQAKLGAGTHVGFPVTGLLIPFGDSTFMEWSAPISGSQGHGRLYAVANQIRGSWDFSRLVFVSDADRSSIDLTPVRPVQLPVSPIEHVYLVPLGDEGQDVSLDWAPAYYRSKLGVAVTVLPRIPLPAQATDTTRRQLVAQRCIETVQAAYPEFAHDPSAVMIGVAKADMYINGLSWNYAMSYRHQGRFAVISSARLRPSVLMRWLNPEWLNSRVEKLLTKDVAMLCFGVPLSSDYSSMVSGGIDSALEVDEMGGNLIGASGRWEPFVSDGDPAVTIYESPGKEPVWIREDEHLNPSNYITQVFTSNLGLGLFVERKTDFVFGDDPELQFSRVYRTADDRSRSFGIGGTNSFDWVLVGEDGVYFDLVFESGSRIHFVRHPELAGQPYLVVNSTANERFLNSRAEYVNHEWQIKTWDGWTYFFPYTPKALPQNVTVLTGFFDPAGRHYEMERDSFGSLLSVSSPSGNWLHFENDDEHRITRITASTGRTMKYSYDARGRLIRAADTDGHVDAYTYDDKSEMLTAAHEDQKPILINEYTNDGFISKQTMSDGRSFEYSYSRETNRILQNMIIDPNKLNTYIRYVQGGYLESLPERPPQ